MFPITVHGGKESSVRYSSVVSCSQILPDPWKLIPVNCFPISNPSLCSSVVNYGPESYCLNAKSPANHIAKIVSYLISIRDVSQYPMNHFAVNQLAKNVSPKLERSTPRIIKPPIINFAQSCPFKLPSGRGSLER